MESTEERLLETFRQTSIGIGVSIGHKLGLFKAILNMKQTHWTATDLARICNCRERYVFEWLSMIASAGLITIDAETNTCHLTDDQKRGLTSPSMAWFNMLPAYFQTFQHISDCMTSEGPKGLRLSEQRDMVSALDSLRDSLLDESFEKSLLSSFPGLQETLEHGCVMCDVGCATGRLVVQLAKRFPNSQIYGLDSDNYVINIAKQRVAEANLNNVRISVQDINSLAETYINKFDIMCALDVIHKLRSPTSALIRIRESLKDGGTLCMIQADVTSEQKNNGTDKLSSPHYLLRLFYSVSNAMACENGPAMGYFTSSGILIGHAQEAGFSAIEQIALSNGYSMVICKK